MAGGNIFLKEAAAVTLQATGSSTLATNNQVAAATANLDNRSGGNGGQNFYASFELNTGFSVAPTVGTIVNLYLVPALDGTNFADVDTTNHNMPPACFVGSFVVNKNQTGAQRLVIPNVPLRALLYKAYVDNQTGQTMAADWTLKVVTDEEQYS